MILNILRGILLTIMMLLTIPIVLLDKLRKRLAKSSDRDI